VDLDKDLEVVEGAEVVVVDVAEWLDVDKYKNLRYYFKNED